MKYIFLDIDGVLNIMGTSYSSFAESKYGQQRSIPMEPHLVRRLEFIIDRLGKDNVRIVISSSWYETDVKVVLNKCNFKYTDIIIGRTPRDKRYRGEQIMDFVKEHNIDEYDYVVLEDEPIDVCGEKCNVVPEHNVIKVDMNEGLSDLNSVHALLWINHLPPYFDFTELATKENYDEYYKIGFRPNVKIGSEEDLERWYSFELRMDTLTMVMQLGVTKPKTKASEFNEKALCPSKDGEILIIREGEYEDMLMHKDVYKLLGLNVRYDSVIVADFLRPEHMVLIKVPTLYLGDGYYRILRPDSEFEIVSGKFSRPIGLIYEFDYKAKVDKWQKD